jgi:hypothetical protein
MGESLQSRKIDLMNLAKLLRAKSEHLEWAAMGVIIHSKRKVVVNLARLLQWSKHVASLLTSPPLY